MININSKEYQECIQKLNSLYNSIPKTSGCMENLEKCKSWCCAIQSPQLFHIEFLCLWNYIIKNWTMDQILDLIKKSVRCYLSHNPVKGCVLFDEKERKCTCHKKRCFNCRIYCITPKEEFEPRYQKMKELYKDKPGVIVRDQCDLAKTENGIEVTTKDTDKWWSILTDIEKSLGVGKANIHDGAGGTYRTYHDHILLYLLNEELLSKMTQIRLMKNISEYDREGCVDSFMACLKNIISGMIDEKEQNTDS